MSKIVFLNDPNTVYDGKFSQIGTHQVRLNFTDAIPSEEVLLSGFNLVNEHNGRIQTRRTDYIYIYKKYGDILNQVELCNDNKPWVDPGIEICFIVGAGGTLNGKTKQFAKNYEDLEIPTPVANINYEFVGWEPELPTVGSIEEKTTYTAYFKYVPTLAEIKLQKVSELENDYLTCLNNGMDIELSTGTSHFSFTPNTATAFSEKTLEIQTISSDYFEFEEQVYSKYDMQIIITKGLYFINRETAYKNNLVEYINKLEDVNSVNAVIYGQDIPSEYINNVYQSYFDGTITEENMSPTRISTLEEHVETLQSDLDVTQIAIMEIYEMLYANEEV